MNTVLLRLGFRLGLLLLLTLAGLLSAASEPSPAVVRVTPQRTDELLANPGMGWQTFHRFADEDANLQGLPSASAYFRFYWREIEPQDGQIDFARFDALLAHARRAGQKLAFRIMCTGSGDYMDVPAWLKEQGCPGVEFKYGGRTHWVPDLASAAFREKHFRLIAELGRRFDGHPDLDLLDLGSVGLWGEWHMSSTTALTTGKAVPLPPPEVRLAIIDAWCRAFPQTSKVILIGSEEGMAQAVARRYGWRADCLGDMGGFSKTWNHMDHFYLQQLAKTGAEDAWKQGPVAWESCWDMRKWKAEGWDIRAIFDYGLRCHASYMNNKSAPIPDGTRPEVERFLLRLGYRLVARAIEHPASVRAGTPAPVIVTWDNLGVAPPYRDDHVALRLRRIEAAAAAPPSVVVTETSIRGWLPGEHRSELTCRLPEGLAPGRYQLALGIVDAARQPAVRLAIVGRDAEGWYPVSAIEITR